MKLTDPVTNIHAVAKRAKAAFVRLGIVTVEDLVMHMPIAYEDRRQMHTIASAPANTKIIVTIKCRVELIQAKRSFRARQMITEVMVSDVTGRMRLIWFGNRFIQHQIKTGDEIIVSGQLTHDTFGFSMKSPDFEKVKEEQMQTATIIPRYALSAGLTQRMMRFLVKRVLDARLPFDDWLPQITVEHFSVCARAFALENIHFPEDERALAAARKRLAVEELLTLQLHSLLVKRALTDSATHTIVIDTPFLKETVATFPFTLTNDQKKVAWAILQDTSKAHPMNRLVQGDVGSGKTAVAALVMMHIAHQNLQSTLMAPTDILATQHFATIANLVGTNVTVALYTRTTKSIIENGIRRELSKKECATLLTSGEIKIIIGTHALLYEPIQFKQLALVVVDEQHRFGVAQRGMLKERSSQSEIPHFLSLTATPIPRTVSLTVYGELDISIIAEKPPGRKSVITQVALEFERPTIYQKIRDEISRGQQAFVVCPRIDDDEEDAEITGIPSVAVVFEDLKKAFPEFRVAMLHGKMKPKEKEALMQQMKLKEIDILVATTVIEVGVDIPSATIMLIEGAERFGLAQLHQLRGRVGRSDIQSYCYVFPSRGLQSNERLNTFASTDNGFTLAEYDFTTRGPGDRYGTSQSGFSETRIADIRDTALVSAVQHAARQLVADDPEGIAHPKLWDHIREYKDHVLHLE